MQEYLRTFIVAAALLYAAWKLLSANVVEAATALAVNAHQINASLNVVMSTARVVTTRHL